MNTPPIDPQAVHLRIRSLVEMNGTVAAVAQACKMKQPTLETYMRGHSLPGALAIACLCKGLGVSADWILFGESQP
jgi:transcriptional regulator with XRE-family HTH domain